MLFSCTLHFTFETLHFTSHVAWTSSLLSLLHFTCPSLHFFFFFWWTCPSLHLRTPEGYDLIIPWRVWFNWKIVHSLRVRLFWVKMIQEIIFPQTRMFGCNGKFHFPEIHFLLTNIYSFDLEIILHSYFQFKSFPKKEREREKREPRSERERGRRESRRSTRGVIVWRVRRESRRSSIAPLVGRSHRSRLRSRFSRAISSSPPLRDLNLIGLD